MNVKNKELFDHFVREHNAGGGTSPTETAITNLVHNSLVNREYKIFGGNGEDVDGNDIDLYDVVLWCNMTKDPYFMICVDIDSNDLILVGCNSEGKLIQKVV